MTDSHEPLTLNQAQLCAAAWHEIRPEWSVPSMMTRLEAHATSSAARSHSFAELLRAGINAALNPKAKTPAVIFLPGKHWLDAEEAKDPGRTSWFGNDTSADCPNHPTVKAWDCRPCRRADPKPANFRDRVAEEAEKARAARAATLTPASTEEAPHDQPEPAAA